ncbi:MAG: YraN family protein [Wenzhouxiangella sp.]
MNQTARQISGAEAEAMAERFLFAQGLRLVERNYRCRAGEIDLVMLDPVDAAAEQLVFVEVRFRPPGALVSAIETVDERKQHKLIQAARHFLMNHPAFAEHPCRFDVIGVEALEEAPHWIANAFETAA